MPAELTVHTARFDEVTPRRLYGILKLRSEIFVVEQNCVYLDMDGRDAEPSALHMWMESSDGEVVAALRILEEGSGVHLIGRVVTRVDFRRAGLGERLMRAAIATAGLPIEIGAQARLAGWYARLGFARCSDEYVEDGIAHVRMRLLG